MWLARLVTIWDVIQDNWPLFASRHQSDPPGGTVVAVPLMFVYDPLHILAAQEYDSHCLISD